MFRDRLALPRAYVVGRVREASEAGALEILRRGRLDPRREALVPPGAALPAGGGAWFAAAATERLHEGHVRVRLPPGASGGGWLVVAASYSPSWRAEVDGQEVEIRPTNHALMGLPVPAGARVVELRADSRPLLAGIGVSAVSLVSACVLACRRRRRPTSARARRSRAATPA